LANLRFALVLSQAAAATWPALCLPPLRRLVTVPPPDPGAGGRPVRRIVLKG
jgi:hypothetical protein